MMEFSSLWLYGTAVGMGIAAGMILGWLPGRRTRNRMEEELITLKIEKARLKTLLEGERSAAEGKLALLQDFRGSLMDTYRTLATGILRENHQDFLNTAGMVLSRYLETAETANRKQSQTVTDMITPVTELLQRFESRIREIERARESAYAGLTEQVHSLLTAQNELHRETGRLVRALRVPHVRGRWGEITLKRVVEMAGMVDHVDFTEQSHLVSEGGPMRPDMIVHLPGGRRIVVDSKVPITAYLESLEEETEARCLEALDRHARQVAAHVQKLSAKSYWEQVQPAPEFVVMFLPGENFFSAAVSRDNRLMETAVEKGVILATPITLISLLKTVSFSWRQEKATQNAREIRDLGASLYERLCSMAGHLSRLGKDIEKCVETFNQTAGSFEKRVLVPSRKLAELGVAVKNGRMVPEPAPIENRPRNVEEEKFSP